MLCENLGRELEVSYLFVTNTSLLPCCIFGFSFVSLHDIIPVQLFSSLLKSSARVCVYIYIYVCVCVCMYVCMCVYICVCVYIYKDRTYRDIFRKEQNLTDDMPITKDMW